MLFENKKKQKIVLFSFLIFSFPVLILILIKVYTLINSFDLYVTSGAEITTLNFLTNLLNNNNLLTNGKQDILYEFYGLNFHLIYFPIIKFFELIGLPYLLSSRLITLLFVLFVPVSILLISKKIQENNFIFQNKSFLFYIFVCIFLLNHQSSSWWVLTYRPDILAIFFSFLGVYFFLCFIEYKKNSFFLISILFCVLAWTLKQNFLFTLSSILIYFILKKNYKYLIFYLGLSVLLIVIFNLLTEYNNLDLLNRSPTTVFLHLEFEDYFKKLIMYLIKNPYLVLFIFFIYLSKDKKINDKKLFYYLIIFFLFLQSSLVAVLHGAGYNHYMVFLFFLISSISFISFKKIKKHFIFISIFLLISSSLNYFQLFNYNIYGRQGLYFDNKEKIQLSDFRKFIQEKISQPTVIIGASNRTEMFLIEDLTGQDTFQLVSFLDYSWKKWLFRSTEEMEENDKIFEDKFKNVVTILVLNENEDNLKKYKEFQKFKYFLEKNNFKYKSNYSLYLFDNNLTFTSLKDLYTNKKNKKIIENRFLIYQKTIF